MRTYVPIWDEHGHELPRLADHPFREPSDVIDWARRDSTIAWKTWPEVWHLDHLGRLRCWYKASSLDGIRDWADDPQDLFRSRREGLASKDGCAPNWLIVETRQPWQRDGVPTEVDAKAFVELRATLTTVGVQLVDAVIFDDEHHCWSLHDLEHPGQPYALIGGG